jgi:hypothetical protein
VGAVWRLWSPPGLGVRLGLFGYSADILHRDAGLDQISQTSLSLPNPPVNEPISTYSSVSTQEARGVQCLCFDVSNAAGLYFGLLELPRAIGVVIERGYHPHLRDAIKNGDASTLSPSLSAVQHVWIDIN